MKIDFHFINQSELNMQTHSSKSTAGLSLIVTILITLSAMILGTTLIMVIKEENRIVSQTQVTQTAKALARIGISHALSTLDSESNWSTNNGLILNKTALNGSYSVYGSAATTDTITIQSIGTYQSETYQMTKHITREILDRDFLKISTANLNIGGTNPGSNTLTYTMLLGLGVKNTHPTRSIQITKLIMSWIPDTQKLKSIKKNGNPMWNSEDTNGIPSGKQPSGALYEIDPIILTPSGNYQFISAEFDGVMLSKRFSIYLILEDGSAGLLDAIPPTGPLQTDLLVVSTSNIYLTASSNNTLLTNIGLHNQNLYSPYNPVYLIRINSFDIAWDYDLAETHKLETATVTTQNTTSTWFTGSIGNNSSVTINGMTGLFNQNESKTLALSFNNDMSFNYFDMTVYFEDHSFKEFQLKLPKMASFLNINKAASRLSNSQVVSMNLKNTHAKKDIQLTSMTVAKSEPLGPDIQSIMIGSNTYYSLNSINRTVTRFLDPYYQLNLDPGTPFISPSTYNITYNFIDNSSVQDPVPISLTSQYLVVDGSIANIKETEDVLDNIQYISFASQPATIIGLTANWAPQVGTIDTVTIGAVTQTGLNGSPGYIALNPISLSKTEIGSISFSNTIADTNFNLTYHLSDGTTRNVYIKLNPYSYVVADNFENGWSGGNGFNGQWSHSTGESSIIGADPYSNKKVLRLKKDGYAKRTMNLAAYQQITIRFMIQINGFLPGDTATFAVYDPNNPSNPNGIVLATWDMNSQSENNYVQYEYTISGSYMSNNSFIRFDTNFQNASTTMKIDEIYFYNEFY